MLQMRSSRPPGRWSETRSPLRLRCDASELPADAAVVDTLARIALVARRHGCVLRLAGCSRELRELIAFMGLDEALPRED
jgi:anti-anti-sigma regulatory factor